MSDDVPIILAHEHGPRRAVFASAASEAQIQQYVAAGWAVGVSAVFQAVRPFDLAKVSVERGVGAGGADLFNVEAPNLAAGTAECLAALPAVAKFNFAFHETGADGGPALVSALESSGYVLLAAHWRDDNIYRMRSLSRIEPLASLQPPDWSHLNLIACRDLRRADMILRIGRVHAAQERRVADLKIGEAVRNDHIAKLEDAVQSLQGRLAGGQAVK